MSAWWNLLVRFNNNLHEARPLVPFHQVNERVCLWMDDFSLHYVNHFSLAPPIPRRQSIKPNAFIRFDMPPWLVAVEANI
jgi:hypothetical protein